jgi:hypothetical protein
MISVRFFTVVLRTFILQSQQSDPGFSKLPIHWILDVISKELNAVRAESKPKFRVLECLELDLHAPIFLSRQEVGRIPYKGKVVPVLN